jgi:hypothetical protein
MSLVGQGAVGQLQRLHFRYDNSEKRIHMSLIAKLHPSGESLKRLVAPLNLAEMGF